MDETNIHKIIAIAIVASMIVFTFASAFVYLQTERAERTGIGNSFVFLNAQYFESSGILIIDLQHFGSSLGSLTRKGFTWYKNTQKIGQVHSVSIIDEDDTNPTDGKIIRIKITSENIPSNAKITLTHSSGFQVVITKEKITRF